MGELFPTHSPPYTQEPRCSAKCPWNSGRTVPISESARTIILRVAPAEAPTNRGISEHRDTAAAFPTKFRREIFERIASPFLAAILADLLSTLPAKGIYFVSLRGPTTPP